jgi:hypothetical protein
MSDRPSVSEGERAFAKEEIWAPLPGFSTAHGVPTTGYSFVPYRMMSKYSSLAS